MRDLAPLEQCQEWFPVLPAEHQHLAHETVAHWRRWQRQKQPAANSSSCQRLTVVGTRLKNGASVSQRGCTGCCWVCEATSEPEEGQDLLGAEGATCTLVHWETCCRTHHHHMTGAGGERSHMYTCTPAQLSSAVCLSMLHIYAMHISIKDML